jgi:hypothetical protein
MMESEKSAGKFRSGHQHKIRQEEHQPDAKGTYGNRGAGEHRAFLIWRIRCPKTTRWNVGAHGFERRPPLGTDYTQAASD